MYVYMHYQKNVSTLSIFWSRSKSCTLMYDYLRNSRKIHKNDALYVCMYVCIYALSKKRINSINFLKSYQFLYDYLKFTKSSWKCPHILGSNNVSRRRVFLKIGQNRPFFGHFSPTKSRIRDEILGGIGYYLCVFVKISLFSKSVNWRGLK